MGRIGWVAAVSLVVAFVGSSGHAAAGPRPAAPPKPPSSFAAMSSPAGSVQLGINLNSGHFDVGGAQAVKGMQVEGTAIDLAGTTALIAAFSAGVGSVVKLPTSSTAFGPYIPLHRYAREGDVNYGAYASGVAIAHGAALVAVEEQGIVLLRASKANFVLDTRVKSPGNNTAGGPHAAGFLTIPRPKAAEYTGVAASRVPTRNGRFLALAIDRVHHTLAVIDGVGTAHPAVSATLTDPDFGPLSFNTTPGMDYGNGNGGMAFSLATATRAAVLTPNGVVVINLAHPTHPKVQSVTAVGADSSDTTSLAVSPNGSLMAVGNLGSIYLLSGFLTVPADQPLTPVNNFITFGSMYPVDAMEFTTTHRLVAQHLAYDPDTTTQFEQLSDYHLPPGGNTSDPPRDSATLAGIPAGDNSMSIFPSGDAPAMRPVSLGKHLRLHQKVDVTMSVRHGVGHYRFRVVGGSLPKGLHLRGHTIKGTPTVAGNKHVRISATNQYGGVVNRIYVVHVRAH